MPQASLYSRSELVGELTISTLSPFLIWDCRNYAGDWLYAHIHETSRLSERRLHPGCRVFALDDVSTQVNGGAAYSEIWLSGLFCPYQDTTASAHRVYEGWCIELSGREGFAFEELKLSSIRDTMSRESDRADRRYPWHEGPIKLFVRVVGFRDSSLPRRNWGCSLDETPVYQPPVGQKIKRILDI